MLEAKVKSAYLYNFTKFVSWPDRSNGPVTVCVIGAPKVAKLLEELASRQGGKFKVITSPEADLSRCHILYIARGSADIKRFLSKVKGQQILTVSDSELFAQRGGVVGFFAERGKMRFEINIVTAREANIKISSKLLELARVVE
ncbi:MAG: YfiR family protein [Sulfurimonadaceae bacterium]|nr:YfiR family protein [Sulfurimonadaceae bacterium]